jgi:GT2 family glycosyltransferase
VLYPKVFIIVLNWNGKHDTMECLKSIHKINYPNFNVIVVDNGSSDDSVETIRDNFPEVTVIETGNNFGYAGGNNIGIRYALTKDVDYILLLNNDTIIDSQLLNKFMEVATTTPDAGIFGAKIYYYSEPEKIWYAGAKWVDKSSKFDHLGQGNIDDGKSFNTITETDYACGCAILIKADVLNKIGLLEEKYFLTFEETDLCFRARKAGFRSYFVPAAKIWHKVSTSFGGEGSALYNYFLTRNKLLWAENNLSLSKRLVLYKHVFCEILIYILPPRFRLNKANNLSLFELLYNSLVEYKTSIKIKFHNPIRKAKLLGVRDYLLRHFGNCYR